MNTRAILLSAAALGLLGMSEAEARCMNTSTGIQVTGGIGIGTGQPVSGESVVCDTTAPNPVTGNDTVSPQPNSSNVSITVLPGAILDPTVRAIGAEESSTVLNQGTVSTHGGNYAYGVNVTGSDNTITNEGLISTFGTNANGLNIAVGGTTANNILINNGAIAVSGKNAAGIQAMSAINTTIINAGSIGATGVSDSIAPAAGVLIGGASSGHFDNSGSVSAKTEAGVKLLSSNFTINNAGTIGSDTGIAVHFGPAITNSTLALQSGSVLNGNIVVDTAITADNTLRLQGAGEQRNNITGTGGFQTLLMDGDNWNFTGNASAIRDVNVSKGQLTITGAIGGTQNVTVAPGGTLRVDSALGVAASTATVGGASGNSGRLGGSGTLGGNVVIEQDGVLAPNAGGAGAASNLNIAGSLTLEAGSVLDYRFGQANTPGGALNDHVNVGGNVSLGGSVNIASTTGGPLDPGIYRVITYAGSLTGGSLTVGDTDATPPAYLSVQISVPGQVNLINTGGLTLNYWDAAGVHDNGVVDGGAGAWNLNDDNWTDAQGSIDAPWSNGGFAIFAGTPGAVSIVSGVQASGMQFAVDGYQLAGGPLTLVDDGTGSAIIRVGDGSGTGMTAAIDAVLAGTTQLRKTDGGTLALGASNTYDGGTRIEGGAVRISNDGNLGNAAGGLTLDGGVLQTTADIDSARTVQLGANGGTFHTDAATTLTLINTITDETAAPGSLVKTGGGALILTSGSNNWTGSAHIQQGELQMGNGGASAYPYAGDIAIEADALLRTNYLNQVLDGVVSGDGALVVAGGNTFLTADNAYTGGTTINGSLTLGNTSNTGSAGSGDILNNGDLLVSRGNAFALDNLIEGSGNFGQNGSGTTTLTNDNSYAGHTDIRNGALYINGNQSAATGTTFVGNIPFSDATLGGSGVIGGNVVFSAVADGATLQPGAAPLQAGTLTIKGNLELAGNTTLLYNLASPGADVAGNDLVNVVGDLTLGDATINVIPSGGTALKIGTYRIFNYGGALDQNTTLKLGHYTSNGSDNTDGTGNLGEFSSDFKLQTVIDGQVNLINTGGMALNYWDGDGSSVPRVDGANGTIDGGDGVWRNQDATDNWTLPTGDLNATWSWSGSGFAVFAGTKGTVSVDNVDGAVTAKGMQFITDGYVIKGDDLTLLGAAVIGSQEFMGTPISATNIRVNSGATARIESNLISDDGINPGIGSGAALLVSDGGTLALRGTQNRLLAILAEEGATLDVMESGNLTGLAARFINLADNSTLKVSNENAAVGNTVINDNDVHISAFTADANGKGHAAGMIGVDSGMTLVQNGFLKSVFNPDAPSDTATFTKSGDGTLTLTGNNLLDDAANPDHPAIDVLGKTVIAGGTLQLGNAGGGVDTGWLSSNGGVEITDPGARLVFDIGGNSNTFTGAISGDGGVVKNGAGTVALTGENTQAGGATINGGELEIGNGGATGSITGNVGTAANTALVFNRDNSAPVVYDGVVSGDGGLTQRGSGRTALTNANTYTGDTRIENGRLQLGNGETTGSIDPDSNIAIANNGALAFNRSNALALNGVISGAGGVWQIGTGVTTLTGNSDAFTGTANVNAGALRVEGALGGAANVTSGATLGGSGVIGGNVNVDAGGILAPNAGGTGVVSTLTINGNLTLNAGAILNYKFGQANANNANTAAGATGGGGPRNDLTIVHGNLTLDGMLNVDVTPGGAFGPGVYRIFNYEGALTDNTLELGMMPAGSTQSLQISVANQINLVVGANSGGNPGPGSNPDPGADPDPDPVPAPLNFWDGATGPHGNSIINGGDGVWQNKTGNNNWTDQTGTPIGVWDNGGFAIFMADAGKVTVDNSLGNVTVSRMQFASDGYAIQGGDLDLIANASGQSIIQVGDNSALGANYATIIGSRLTGNTQLVKTDLGRLVLTGANVYANGTAINGGTLQIGNGGNTGSVTGNIGMANNSTLAFNRSDDYTHGGVISGNGNLVQGGPGALTLTRANTYTGNTAVNSGTLKYGAANALPVGTAVTVATGAMLDVGGFSPTVASLGNSGTVNIASTDPGIAPVTLTVNGDYIGNGGKVILGTQWRDDASMHDRLVINGNATGVTLLQVLHRGDASNEGAQTATGINLVRVGGASDPGAFALDAGSFGYRSGSSGVIAAGAYDYALVRGGNGGNPDDWYLVSEANVGNSGQYRPETGAYLDNRLIAMQSQWHTLRDRQSQAPGLPNTSPDNPDANSWAHFAGSFGSRDSRRFKSKDDSYLLHLGSDFARWQTGDQGSLRVGAMGMLLRSTGRTTASGGHANQTIDGQSLGLYATWHGNADPAIGPYADAWLMGGRFGNKISGKGLPSEKYHATAWALSLEAGHGFIVHQTDSGKGTTRIVVQPQFQIIGSRYDAGRHAEDNGTIVSRMNDNIVTTRLGARVYADLRNAEQERLRPFIEANWWHGPSTHAMTFDSDRVSDKLPANLGELKLGVEGNLKSNLVLWSSAGIQKGNGHSAAAGNIGIRYIW